MLKNYMYKGKEFQFEEKEAPSGAVLIKKAEKKKADPGEKAKSEPKNKAR